MAFTTIQGSGANDATSFVGSSGVDTILIQNIDDNVFLGAQAANDTVTFANFKGLVSDYTLRGGQGNDTIGAGGQPTLNTSLVNGNIGVDVITLNGATGSTVYGGQGNDQLTSNALLINSIVNGNRDADNSSITAGASSSSIFGGKGDDRIDLDGTFSSIIVQGDNDNDTINLGTIAGNESVTGSTINGNAGNDTINGAATVTTFSTSTVYGGAGNDSLLFAANGTAVALSGDTGNDIVTASAFNDTAFGGDGTDTITGNAGADTMSGNGGADQFSYGTLATIAAQTGTTTATVDVINDFTTTVDSIQTGTAGAGVFGTGAAGGYATLAAAVAVALGAGNNYEINAVGSGTSWTAYLLVDTAGAGGTTPEAAIQLGTIGQYSSVAAAQAAIVAADIIA